MPKPSNHPDRRIIYVPDEIYRPAMDLAKSNKIKMSDAIRMLLGMWLRGEVSPTASKPPKK